MRSPGGPPGSVPCPSRPLNTDDGVRLQAPPLISPRENLRLPQGCPGTHRGVGVRGAKPQAHRMGQGAPRGQRTGLTAGHVGLKSRNRAGLDREVGASKEVAEPGCSARLPQRTPSLEDGCGPTAPYSPGVCWVCVGLPAPPPHLPGRAWRSGWWTRPCGLQPRSARETAPQPRPSRRRLPKEAFNRRPPGQAPRAGLGGGSDSNELPTHTSGLARRRRHLRAASAETPPAGPQRATAPGRTCSPWGAQGFAPHPHQAAAHPHASGRRDRRSRRPHPRSPGPATSRAPPHRPPKTFPVPESSRTGGARAQAGLGRLSRSLRRTPKTVPGHAGFASPARTR